MKKGKVFFHQLTKIKNLLKLNMCNSMKARMEGKKFDSLLNVTYIDDSGILLTESSLRASRAKVLKL